MNLVGEPQLIFADLGQGFRDEWLVGPGDLVDSEQAPIQVLAHVGRRCRQIDYGIEIARWIGITMNRSNYISKKAYQQYQTT